MIQSRLCKIRPTSPVISRLTASYSEFLGSHDGCGVSTSTALERLGQKAGFNNFITNTGPGHLYGALEANLRESLKLYVAVPHIRTDRTRVNDDHFRSLLSGSVEIYYNESFPRPLITSLINRLARCLSDYDHHQP